MTYDLFGAQVNHQDIQIRVVNSVITDWVMYKDFYIGGLSSKWT